MITIDFDNNHRAYIRKAYEILGINAPLDVYYMSRVMRGNARSFLAIATALEATKAQLPEELAFKGHGASTHTRDRTAAAIDRFIQKLREASDEDQ